MTDTTSAAPSDAVLQPDDSEFEQWYATMFKPAMERSPFDKYVARQAWYAAWNRALQPALDCHHRTVGDECAAYDAQGGK